MPPRLENPSPKTLAWREWHANNKGRWKEKCKRWSKANSKSENARVNRWRNAKYKNDSVWREEQKALARARVKRAYWDLKMLKGMAPKKLNGFMITAIK